VAVSLAPEEARRVWNKFLRFPAEKLLFRSDRRGLLVVLGVVLGTSTVVDLDRIKERVRAKLPGLLVGTRRRFRIGVSVVIDSCTVVPISSSSEEKDGENRSIMESSSPFGG